MHNNLPWVRLPQNLETINSAELLPSPPVPVTHTPFDMNYHPCSYAQSILAGTAEVEGGCIHGIIVGDRGKVWSLSVVEVLDGVCDIFPALHEGLRKNRH